MNIREDIIAYCSSEVSLSDRNRAFEGILNAFLNNKCSMLSFVDQCLELNSDDSARRKRAVNLLGKLLTDSKSPSDDNTACVFFDFFSKRLNDFLVTEEALKAMVLIEQRYHLSILPSADIFIADVSTTIKVGTLKYSSRRLVYSLLISFLSSSTLLSKAESVTQQIISIIDGEKDPRGVVQVCTIISTVLHNLSSLLLPNTLNDLFMIANGYFPVTYITPPLVAGTKDIVTSEQVCESVSSALTATSLTIPLLLPYIETALKDSSPNSKTQGSGVLRRLCERWGWSKQMCEGCVMTEGEMKRWVETVVEEYVDSTQTSPEETNLHHVIRYLSLSSEPFWSHSMHQLAIDKIIKSPVSPLNLHLSHILRLTCLSDSSLFSSFLHSFIPIITQSHSIDIIDGTITVFATVIIAQPQPANPQLTEIRSILVEVLQRVTVLETRKFPLDQSALLLGHLYLLDVSESQSDPQLSSYLESFLTLPLVNDDDVKNVVDHLLEGKVCEGLVNSLMMILSDDCINDTETALFVLRIMMQSHACQKLAIFLSSSFIPITTSSKQLILGRKLIKQIVELEGKVDVTSELSLCALQCQKSDVNLRFDSIMMLLSQCTQLNRNAVLSVLLNNDVELKYIEEAMTVSEMTSSTSILFLLNQLWNTGATTAAQHILRYCFTYSSSHSLNIIHSFFPQLQEIPVEVAEEEFLEWVRLHPFFSLLSSLHVKCVFSELMRVRPISDASLYPTIQKWSLMSLILELHIPSELLQEYSLVVNDNFNSVCLSDEYVNQLVNRLVIDNGYVSEEYIILAYRLLNNVEGGRESVSRCVRLAIDRGLAVDESMNCLYELLQNEGLLIVDHLPILLPQLMSLLTKERERIPVTQLLVLRVLKEIANLPLSVVFMYATSVIRGLEPALDSPQRIIREMTGRVRNLWKMIH